MQDAKRQNLDNVPIEVSNSEECIGTENSYDIESDIKNHENESEKPSDEQVLKDLLQSWGVTSLFDCLHDSNIAFKDLELIEESDYAALMTSYPTQIGETLVFRSFHRKWKKSAIVSLDSQSHKVNVEMILKNGGEKAKAINRCFKTYGKFTHTMRNNLADLIIIEGFVSREDLDDIADQIVAIFPGELKTFYYEKLPGKPPTGVLHRRFNQFLTANTQRNQSQSIELDTGYDITNELIDDVRSSVNFLNDEKNFGDNMDKDLIIKHWLATYQFRKYEIDAPMDWLPLRKPLGDYLIHLDFTQKYGRQCAYSLEKFDQFIIRNDSIILSEIRNPIYRQEVRKALSNEDKENAHRTIVMGLFHLTCMVPFKVATKKCIWTPTIPDSKNAFCVMLGSLDGMEKEVEKRRIIREKRV